MNPVNRSKAFSTRECDAMLAAAPCSWWRAFIALGVSSGLRTSEMLRLHVSDVDERTRSIRVTSEPVQTVEEVTLRRCMPPHRERTVPIEESVLAAVRRLRDERPTDAHVFVPDWKLDQLWPRIVSHEPLTNELLSPGLARWFQMVQNRARVVLARDTQESLSNVPWPRRELQALRTTAIHRLALRLSPRSLAAHLGCASVRSVLGFYDADALVNGGGVR